ncbi:MAG: hypothetical protein KKB51_07495 [Candidatus Riflebacteria bacterium]|nr:hypothetical protein [Candidatus Riflebacteria bacterium]
MELIRKISQQLSKLRDRKAAVKYGEADVSAPCVINIEEFPLLTWQNFLSYVDEAQNSPDSRCRNCLQRLGSMNTDSQNEYFNFFNGLAKNSDEWRPVLSFAEIPAQFDNDLFDSITSEYSKAKSVAEQTGMISTLFCTADPTSLELLCQLLEGNVERYQQTISPAFQDLVVREKAARDQLDKMLSESWTDEIRWWLIRSIANAAFPVRNFLKSRVPESSDDRLACMTFPILLKAGFALLKNLNNMENPKAEQLQKLYSGQLTRLTDIISSSPT